MLEGLFGKAYRVRAVGSLAITISYVAAGRFDGMLCPRPCRSVDVAAAQLIARAAGASLAFDGVPLDDAHLDLAARYTIAAGLDEEMLGTLLGVLRGAAVETDDHAPGLIDWKLAERTAAPLAVAAGRPPTATRRRSSSRPASGRSTMRRAMRGCRSPGAVRRRS